MTVVSKFTSSIHSPQTTILIRAVLKDFPLAAKAAIALGANVHVRGYHRDTLLHVCKSTDMGNILLKAGARIGATNDYGVTPLHSSMRRALIKLSMLFISSNAPLNAQENDGTAPLHLAQSSQVNEALLVHGANPDVQNKDGDTPLLLALRDKGSPVVAQLMNAGANQFIKNYKGHDAQAEFHLRQDRMNDEIQKMAKALAKGPATLWLTDPVVPEFTKLKQAKTAIAGASHKVSSYLPSFSTKKPQLTPLPTIQEETNTTHTFKHRH